MMSNGKNDENYHKQKDQHDKTANENNKTDHKKKTTFADPDTSTRVSPPTSGPLPSNVLIIDNGKDLTDAIKAAHDKLVVLYFFAVWCGSCKMVSPRVDEMSRMFASAVVFIKIDSEVCEAAAEQYEVSVLPFFVFLKGGQKVDTFIGSNPDKLRELVSRHSRVQQ